MFIYTTCTNWKNKFIVIVIVIVTPNGFPETAKAKTQMQCLKRQVRHLVDTIFNPASQEDMKLVAETVRQYQLDNADDDDDAIALDDIYAYCRCKEGAAIVLLIIQGAAIV